MDEKIYLGLRRLSRLKYLQDNNAVQILIDTENSLIASLRLTANQLTIINNRFEEYYEEFLEELINVNDQVCDNYID